MSETDVEIKFTLKGERAAIGGYLPQYDEFAINVYNAIENGDLEEIRVADMAENVGKLDDVVYVTTSEVNAYQIKWSNAGDKMAYIDFKTLIPEIVDGWRKLRQKYPDKIIKPHLLTNKRLTSGDDSIKAYVGTSSEGFAEYEREVLRKLKSKEPIDSKWGMAVKDLSHLSTLHAQEWVDFWSVFSFQFDYKQELIEVAQAGNSQRTRDILDINRMIVEMAGRPGFEIKLTAREIIARLGWSNRFETIYDHNLNISEESYVPNSAGLALLDAGLEGKKKGYLFLQGSPGSGKSTLLTQWIRARENPSVRFYAFDFLHPSSQKNNDSSRGSDITFLNDIVIQIHNAGIQEKKTLPITKDQETLKKRFYDQLAVISENYQESGLPFIIIVDGLDHITREYKGCLKTLMEVLPSPPDIPEGVVFVLGSQHFDHLGLNQSIEKEIKSKGNLVEIPPLSKDEVIDLSRKLLARELTTEPLLDKCWRKSQGHPLYLRYLLNQISVDGLKVLETLDDTLEEVDDYYARIVGPLLEKSALKNALGLISRIAGAIKLEDIRSLCSDDALLDIKYKMWHLFRYDKAGQELSFFHNSFRQFLLNKTAEDVLTGEICKEIVIKYYLRLSDYFKESWDRGYYLYNAEEYDQFIEVLTPDYLFAQAQSYRPLWSIRRDVERGIEIARQKKDPYLLVRYLLMENQLSQMDNQDYSVFSLLEDFIKMGRGSLAKAIIREGRQLHCSQEHAMDLAIEFLKQGDREEANLLFELSYPDFLMKRQEKNNFGYHDIRNKTNTLIKWVKTAAYFISWSNIEKRIAIFLQYLQSFAAHNKEEFDSERNEIDFIDAYLESLVAQSRWSDLDKTIACHFKDEKYCGAIFYAYDAAIVHLSEDSSQNELLNHYFGEAVRVYDSLADNNSCNLRMAFLAVKAKQPDEIVLSYIKNVDWKSLGSFYQDDTGQPFESLSLHIFYVMTRARLRFHDDIRKLVPEDTTHGDNYLMVNYARRVFTIAQMTGRAQAGDVDATFLSQVKYSIREYDSMQSPIPRNKYRYTLSQQRGDFYEYVVKAARCFGKSMIADVASEFNSYFTEDTCRANPDSRRLAIMALYRIGFDKSWCIERLRDLNQSMMVGQDTDGRERELLRQGSAWLEMRESVDAESCFRKMIEESFGVGYRKDYQPSLFAEWIGSAIENDRTNAIEHIHWLTSRLNHIETIAQSRTRLRAAEKLLEETFSFNICSGLKLSKWLLEKEYDYFQSVSSSLLQVLLKAAQTEEEYRALFRYYTAIHLYVDDNDSFDIDTGLLTVVISEGKRIIGDSFEAYSSRLKERIETECPESIVEGLLKALEEYGEDHIEDTHQSHRDSDRLLEDAKQLLKEGQKEQAWLKTIEAIETSSPSGWSRFYDGGTRIDACKVLLQVDEKRGREYVTDLFARDIPGGYTYGTIHYLDEIVPLLTNKVDHLRLYREELSYMNRMLREENCRETDKPEIDPEECSVCDIIRNWLLYLASFPTVCIMERAKILLAYLYNESTVSLQTGSIPERVLLEVGCYLTELGSKKLSDFIDIAKKAALSENYQFRVYASIILSSLNVPIPLAPSIVLPATYSFVFTESKRKIVLRSQEKKNAPEINWHDASSIMSVASHWSSYLSECSGIDQRTLEYRAVELMKKYGDITSKNEEEDKILSHHLDSINLRYPYKKAHAQAALDGMLAVASELIDGKAITRHYDDCVFLSRDFGNISIEARQKPAFIQRIADQKSWSVEKTWLNEAHLSPRLNDTFQKYEGKYVIGEHCHVKKMGDIIPIEEFQSMISLDNKEKEILYSNSIFGESPFMQETKDYYTMGWDDPEFVLMRGGYFTDFSNRSHWIAINPALACLINLRPCKDGHFAWQNSAGEKVVESIFWQSGNINDFSRHNYEVSEGWLVLAREDILNSIFKKGRLYSHKMVIRRLSDNLSDNSHKAYTIMELNPCDD